MTLTSAVPSIYIVGAPRCGTTAMSSYLAEHPDICFAVPKEPHFFAFDMPGYREFTDQQTYMQQCFAHATPDQRLAEGSVWYLYSRDAVGAILDANPQARFIVMLRNPAQMVPSFHQKAYESLDEDVASFAQAWALQTERASGNRLPPRCRDARVLQYADIGLLGKYTQRLFATVPAAQRHAIVYDDLLADPGQVYRQTLAFLGVADDGRQDFERVNANQRVLNQALLEQAWNPPPMLVNIARGVRRVLGVERLNVLPRLRRALMVTAEREPLAAHVSQQMQTAFADDIALLGELLQRDLSAWQSADQPK